MLLGECHDNNILKVQILLLRNFVVITQAHSRCVVHARKACVTQCGIVLRLWNDALPLPCTMPLSGGEGASVNLGSVLNWPPPASPLLKPHYYSSGVCGARTSNITTQQHLHNHEHLTSSIHQNTDIEKIQIWRTGITPIKEKRLREFGLKFWRPTNSERRSESCSENRVFT